MIESKQILQTAQELYEDGDRQGAIDLLLDNKEPDKVLSIFIGDELAEAQKAVGWNLYYMAIKDFREVESKKIDACNRAESFFKSALENTENKEILISVANGLPLALWIQGKKEEAFNVSNNAAEKFHDTPSVWNTLSILCRWAKQYEKSIEVCEMVYKTALDLGDFRTAGHGKHNQGDALKNLGKDEDARTAYEEAKELYLKFEEESGQKVTVHINGVVKKIALLIVIIALIICPERIKTNSGVLSNSISVETPSFFIQKMINWSYIV